MDSTHQFFGDEGAEKKYPSMWKTVEYGVSPEVHWFLYQVGIKMDFLVESNL